MLFVGNIRPYFSPRVVTRCSSFLANRDVMSASESILPASLRTPLRVFMLLFCLFIMWVSLRTSTGGNSIPHFDKIAHAGVYGILAFGVSLAWPDMSKIKIWIACLFYGGAMELAQGSFAFMRTPSILDFIANGVGAALALCIVGYLNKKYA